jgi:iron complex outermembrane recepter protein
MTQARSRVAASLLAAGLALPAAAAERTAAELADLTLEQLANIVVTSVARREQALGAAATSIYVISPEDIRRSGASSIPEALRLAPNLFVARADTNQYAISARGFANVLANRMLVLIDGRIVYSPLFSGVFWEAQDVMLEDVERIEVISGPGATLWGANAVNGVINVITRTAGDTQGTLITAGAGSNERGGAVRFGGELPGNGHYRLYAKYYERDASRRADRARIADESTRGQAGFRADWVAPERIITVQGDVYDADIEQQIGGSRDLSGANLIARWTQQTRGGSRVQVQAYLDRAEREQPGAIRSVLDIFDVELQQGFALGERNQFLWGGTYRRARDDLQNLAPASFGFIPDTRHLTWYSVFAQNEWRVLPELALTAGLKAEHNDYTGVEWLPSLRFAWTPNPGRLLWGTVSRAVRAPSRIDREFFIPASPPFLLAGGPDFKSEVSRVYELGYRAQATPRLSYSLTTFYHDHERLRSQEPGIGVSLENRIVGSTRGVEAWGSWRVMPSWRLDAGWVELRQKLGPEPGSLATTAQLGNDPRRWITWRSHLDISARHELDVMARYVGALRNPAVPSYVAVDARWGAWLTKGLQVSLLGENLLDRSHPEWGVAGARAEHRRSVHLKLKWRQR